MPACLQVTGGGRGGLYDVKWRSCYYQLICINRPHCCKFLLSQHQPPCLSLPSSLLYFSPCPSSLTPQPALPSRSPLSHVPLMPRYGSRCLPAFSPAPLLLTDFPSLCPSHSSVAASPLENCWRMHRTRLQKPWWGLSASSGLAPAKEPPRGAGGAAAFAVVQVDSAVQCVPCGAARARVQASTVTCAGAALPGPSFTWSPLAKAAKTLYLI